MEKTFLLDGKYINIPVKMGKEEYITEFFIEGEKFTELNIPVDKSQESAYECDFYAQIPFEQFKNKELIIKGDLPEAFLEAVYCTDEKVEVDSKRPKIHFTTGTGWTNDPNGLVYKDGVYHLYFQYNPVNTIWNNMSWGHAVSKDLLHWEQKDIVMLPDEDGDMFSGSAIVNDRKMLGLSEDALVFFYTAAEVKEWSKGKQYTQKIAYSTDGGESLVKIKKPCVPTIKFDNRDPKVFWHEESKAYVMVLWIEEQDFAVLRSTDLENWEETDRFHLDGGWECPDLFELKAPDGSSKWFFWCAQGYYFTGEFDGYKFKSDGTKRPAYVNEIPYAAQTYSNTGDRRISIPWIRYENDGRFFTGACGIPVEFSCDANYNLIQKPVKELMESAVLIDSHKGECLVSDNALVVEMSGSNVTGDTVSWKINGTDVAYFSKEGIFKVGQEQYSVLAGCDNFKMIIDDRILEVFFNDGQMLGTFDLKNKEVSFDVENQIWDEIKIYEIR